MIDRSHTLPVKRQAKELGISRGSVYYLPRPVSSSDLACPSSKHLAQIWRGGNGEQASSGVCF